MPGSSRDSGEETVNFDNLLLQQRSAMKSVHRALENFKKLGRSKHTLGTVRNRLTNLKDTYKKCQQLHDNLLNIATEDDLKQSDYFREDHFFDCEDAFNATSDFMNDILTTLECEPVPVEGHGDHTADNPARSTFKLPRINLPTFSGNVGDWESFRDRFTSMVINDHGLTRSSKLHYLCASLTGDALKIVSHLKSTEANFEVAWRLLTERFDNKRRLISEHLHELHNLPQLSAESATELRKLRDTANIAIEALRNLERSVDHWDDLLVYLVSRGLDKTTRKAWELKLGDDSEYPAYDTLNKFLESRIRALESIPSSSCGNKRSESTSKPTHARHVPSHNAVSASIKCPACKANHYLSNCSKFREMSVVQRTDLVKKGHRCLNCLSSKHKVTECPSSYSCRACKLRHHSLLHVKMYRQILVDRRDTEFQRILWRQSPTDPVGEYRLTTVTYGTGPAPYLALRVLKQLVIDEGASHPLAVKVLQHCIYVDDCLFGADDKTQAVETRNQLIAILDKGKFKLSKWASNCPDLLLDIEPTTNLLTPCKSLDAEDSVKILGIEWAPEHDSFHFRINLLATDFITKRDVLSAIAKIFDPLGWVTPVVITAKVMMQKLWRLNISWDDPLPSILKDEWLNYYSDLSQLSQVSIPRWIGYDASTLKAELHGFADASTLAYGAVVYLRLVNDDRVTVSLLAAKSKVAPLKTLTVPRLELSAAQLLAKLMVMVRASLETQNVPTTCWTDSTITLDWIGDHPSRWKTFVANRVADIQTSLPSASWRHVPTSENPADYASRGQPIREFIQNELWWNGPSWLRQSRDRWPSDRLTSHSRGLPEQRAHTLVQSATVPPQWDLGTRYSSWLRLVRVTAYIIRFVSKSRARQPDTAPGTIALLPSELNDARQYWLRQIQHDLFPIEMKALTCGHAIPSKSPLLSLNPFLDTNGLLRVGGRLDRSDLAYDASHPIILATHPLVRLLITHVHIQACHAGPQLTLRLLRDNYWITRARSIIRSVLFKCLICTRENAKVPTELMGSLPPVRVTRSSRPFLHCGLDYAGPYLMRTAPGRGHKTVKAYVVLFICMSTKAIHLDLVSDYTSAAFLAAFRRFCARRGIPSDMYSDNGKNFVGADKELTILLKGVQRDSTIGNEFANEGVTWHFLPPHAPHFGGLWEAGVRSVKYHLRRVMRDRCLTFEEWTTLLCQIEAALNSRPIAPLSDRFDDYSTLTPGHFVIGSALLTIPEPSLLNVKENRLSRWQLLRKMFERMWDAWRADYLHTLTQRSKWRFIKNSVKVGQLVLLRNDLAPPCKWKLGRVTSCFPGPDGLTRVVSVRTAESEYKRPISKLCILPVDLGEANSD